MGLTTSMGAQERVCGRGGWVAECRGTYPELSAAMLVIGDESRKAFFF